MKDGVYLMTWPGTVNNLTHEKWDIGVLVISNTGKPYIGTTAGSEEIWKQEDIDRWISNGTKIELIWPLTP